ncbi:adenine deaminase [Thermosulfidibacter takaii ABI70S6]|uniref:Adenine deaminase n=1 Tax=Thermosulfidibacter takaii (strain DSM 17441 / JCM 13301 / NBRC 103674 / ABI70S6) TaxID=1298851 RepID=A0A0S3QR84_THET7|nr:adenine deaminase [Thermosulfidibacter takaii]BAT70854.1 adenine deaminase [Thermosulfidibacter takaii ABI70S6]
MALDIPLMKSLINVATKREKADLVIKGCMVLDVFCGKLERKDVAIKDGYVAGLGHDYEAHNVLDLPKGFVLPGFIDAHIHIESSMLNPVEFAKVVLPRGTTAVVADPHEIANVAGNKGIQYMLDITEGLPVDFFFTVPSCVPATTEFETAGAVLGVEDIAEWLVHPRIVGLGEVMNFPGVINGDEEVLRKIYTAISVGKRVDGHAPGVTGDALCAYCSTGIASDHECTHLQEAEDKLKRGMYIMIREGSTAKNMAALVPLVRAYGVSRFMLVSDDRHADDLLEEGHVDELLRKAVYMGLPPNIAVRTVTFNPAFYYNMKRRGAVAPGYIGDIVIVEDLKQYFPLYVIKNGNIVAKNKRLLIDLCSPKDSESFKFNVSLTERPFRVEAKGERIRVIGVVLNEIITEHLIEEAKIENGEVVADVDRDILKIAVVERHRGTGNVGVGFVKGLGIKKGAIASSVAHDSHNIIVVGANDEDMELAVKKIVDMNGGLTVVVDGGVKGYLELPIGGLMSDKDATYVSSKLKELKAITRALGAIPDNPFMALSFLALPVIPKLKITDKGLVDVEKFTFVDLFVN